MVPNGFAWIARFGLAFVTIALFVFSLLGTISEPLAIARMFVFTHFDKIGHSALMFILTTASLAALPRIQVRWLMAGSLALAAVIEIVQGFGPRSADVVDFIASCAGVFVALLIYLSFASRWSHSMVSTTCVSE